MRDLIKDIPLVKDRKVGRDREKKSKEEKEEEKKPSTWRDLNPRLPDYEACSLLLCCTTSARVVKDYMSTITFHLLLGGLKNSPLPNTSDLAQSF